MAKKKRTRKPLWEQLAEDEGIFSKQEKMLWKSNAVKRYHEARKTLKTQTPLQRYKIRQLGYALRVTHTKPTPPKLTKESVLKTAKKVLLETPPTIAQVGYDRFLKQIEQLPLETKVYIQGQLDFLTNKWGEDVIQQYLDKLGILDDDATSGTYNPYLEVLALSYLYRLEAALALAESGEILADDSENYIMAVDAIEKGFKSAGVKQNLYNYISEDMVIEHLEKSGIKKYFDEESGELE